jgi:glycosyltransferase involved in cell wall biosynthesis
MIIAGTAARVRSIRKKRMSPTGLSSAQIARQANIGAVPDPRVSVVVSTYNRPARLARLLEALRAQTLPPDAFEVIVVDNGSGPETGAVLARESARGGLTVRSERHQLTRGPGGGRNTGWKLARAPLIAFTDDDCRPEPNWLEAALAVALTHPGALIQGPTLPDPEELALDGVLSHTVRVERLGPYYETSNIFYPRTLLETLGGFDESFGLRPAGEDTDLALRAIERGAEAVFAPDAVVLHAVERVGVRGKLRVSSRWGPAVRVIAEHPNARAELYRGLFWNVWHYLLWRSLLALAAPRWLRQFIMTRHAISLERRARELGGGAWAVPVLLLDDAVESWAIARGAWRYRTFVL